MNRELNQLEAKKLLQAVDFEIGRTLTPKEMATINRWQNSGFDFSIIYAACAQTKAYTYKPTIAYANAILEHWKSQGCFTLDDVINLEEKHKKSEAPKESSQKQDKPEQKAKQMIKMAELTEHFENITFLMNMIENELGELMTLPEAEHHAKRALLLTKHVKWAVRDSEKLNLGEIRVELEELEAKK